MSTSPPGRATALIAYIPFVGFMISYFINKDESHAFATWHIKNMFGLFLMFVVAMVVQSQIDMLAGDIIWFICCGLWLFCLAMAFFNKQKGLPFLSEKFQSWFTFLD